MRNGVVFVIALSSYILAGTNTGGHAAARGSDHVGSWQTLPQASAWSEPANGLRARLLSASETSGGMQGQLSLDLEIQNVLPVGRVVPIWWKDLSVMLDLS